MFYSNDGLMSTSNPENLIHLQNWNKITDEYENEKDKWIKNLIKNGYKASHPNDGWVDRENYSFRLVYPHFDYGIKIGDKVMLGWHSGNERAIKVVSIREGKFGDKVYSFKDLENIKPKIKG